MLVTRTKSDGVMSPEFWPTAGEEGSKEGKIDSMLGRTAMKSHENVNPTEATNKKGCGAAGCAGSQSLHVSRTRINHEGCGPGG